MTNENRFEYTKEKVAVATSQTKGLIDMWIQFSSRLIDNNGNRFLYLDIKPENFGIKNGNIICIDNGPELCFPLCDNLDPDMVKSCIFIYRNS